MSSCHISLQFVFIYLFSRVVGTEEGVGGLNAFYPKTLPSNSQYSHFHYFSFFKSTLN